MRDLRLPDWFRIRDEMQTGAVLLTERVSDNPGGQIYYLYGYKDYFYVSEIGIELANVPLLINREQEIEKEKLQKEIDRIRAMAEVEGAVRLPISDDVQILVWNRDGGKCVKCGSQELLEFDHIIPVSKGGSNSARNIQLLCQRCNRTKLDKIGG